MLIMVKVTSGFCGLTLNVSIGTFLYDASLVNEHMSLITNFPRKKDVWKSTSIARLGILGWGRQSGTNGRTDSTGSGGS